MWTTKGLAMRAACGLLVSAAAILPCGPFFGIEALRDRSATLLAAPALSFREELKALSPAPGKRLRLLESFQKDAERSAVESQELTPTDWTRVQAVRKAANQAAASMLARELPPAVREYTLGATSFDLEDMTAANTHFEAVLQMPEDERRSREVWARYMLGRVALKASQLDKAAAAFADVRAAVQAGAPDPLGLGLASLGEQARVLWRQGFVVPAVHLYAQQAGYGSETAIYSLVFVAHQILGNPGFLQQAIVDPIARRLLFVVLNNDDSHLILGGEDPVTRVSLVDQLTAALEQHGITQVAGAGLLASAAYRAGRFDLAERLARRDDGVIAAWILAKSALRHGDRDKALKYFDHALVGLERSRDKAAIVQLRAELGVLRVSRGEYLQAIDLFRSAFEQVWDDNRSEHEWDPNGESYGFGDYWGDVVYLAERVLTIDELRQYLQSQEAQFKSKSRTNLNGSAIGNKRLRRLLARRLIRAGRYSEAAELFDNDEVLRAAALAYQEHLSKADSWWRFKTTRAKAAFHAATLAKQRGMELLGYEGQPDYAMWNGSYQSWPEAEHGLGNKSGEHAQAVYESNNEQRRVTESQPRNNVRFQYRLVAVDEAMKAADLLPPRSQAYAAVLCQATSWIIDGQPARAQQVYQRYLQHGAYVPWGNSFGRSCPEPDFAGLSFTATSLRSERMMLRHARAHSFLAAAVGLLTIAVMGLLAVLTIRRRII